MTLTLYTNLSFKYKMKNNNLENFNKLVSNENSSWLDKFSQYKSNKEWLDKSALIAVNVLEALKDKKMSQKDLAERMNVSAQQVNKILKGKQNLSLETICKLEQVLNLSLIQVLDYKRINDIQTESTQIITHQKTLVEEFNKKAPITNLLDIKINPMKIVYKNPYKIAS